MNNVAIEPMNSNLEKCWKECKFNAKLMDFYAIKINNHQAVKKGSMKSDSTLQEDSTEKQRRRYLPKSKYIDKFLNLRSPKMTDWNIFDCICVVDLGLELYGTKGYSSGSSSDMSYILKDWEDYILHEKDVDTKVLRSHVLLQTKEETMTMIADVLQRLGQNDIKWKERATHSEYNKIHDIVDKMLYHDWRNYFNAAIYNKCNSFGSDKMNFFRFARNLVTHYPSMDPRPLEASGFKATNNNEAIEFLMSKVPKLRLSCWKIRDVAPVLFSAYNNDHLNKK
jgi:hypothetical protein